VASLRTGPPGAGELLDGAVSRLREVLPALLAATAAVVLPAGLLAASAPLWPRPARPAVVALPLLVGAALALAADTILLADGGLGLRTRPAAALRRATRRTGPLLVLVVLGVLQVALAAVAFVLPALGRLGGQQAALPVLLLEEVGPREALRRSRFLLRGQEKRALGAQAGAVAAAACLVAVPLLALLVLLPLPSAGSDTLTATRALAGGLVLALATLPPVAAVQFVLFLSRREQLEALDLQLAVQALDDATRPAAPASP